MNNILPQKPSMKSMPWRKTIRLLRHPRFFLAWFIPLWILLGPAKIAIFAVSFKNLAPRLGKPIGIEPWTPLLSPSQELRARRIGHAIRLTSCHNPWESNCFPQAVVARLLLGIFKLPYILYFGLTTDGKLPGMQAHAWITSSRVHVTGGIGFGQFTVVGTLAAPGLVLE